MASSHHLFSLLFLLLLFPSLLSTSTSSRTNPSSTLHPTTTTTTTPPPSPTWGPIETHNQCYQYACHPDRFNALGLKMSDFNYCNKNLSYYDRVDDIVGRLTLEEKVEQISDYAYGVVRIGLPEYKWWSEILHGVSQVGQWGNGTATHFDDVVPGATQFPEVINSAASFNESLWKAIAQAVSTEARAMYNLGRTYLTFWSPVINLPRDPRWGRIMETPGEDPFISGIYAINFVRGLQDIEGQEVTKDLNTRPIKVGSCCKHFAAYDIENWLFTERFSYNARVTEQDMQESFNVPFEMCVKEGDSISVMCSYNQVNGFPSCADPRLLSQTIRGEWNLHGYIVSDCYIFDYLHDNQKWLHASREDLVAKVMNAGLDLECGWEHHNTAIRAVKQGKLKEKEIDRALTNLYLVLMRLGFFDGMPQYDSLGIADICTNATMDLAADAARQGIVLLKNINDTLPLNKDNHKKLALGGTHTQATVAMKGNYYGKECRYVTPLDALKLDAQVEYILGCDIHCTDKDASNQMQDASKRNDATIVFMGIDTTIEAETIDRTNLTLPAGQISFIQDVAQASLNPIILVILSAGGLDISFAQDNPKIGAILWAGYPGEEGGRAIADVIYGRYNPGGRLPITWYKDEYTQVIPMTYMQFRPNPQMGYPGRTYKFFDGPTIYPFGHGLSYTQFKYVIRPKKATNINVKLGKYQQCLPLTPKANSTAPPCPSANVADLACQEEIKFKVEVTNIGKLDGNEVLIVYAKPPSYVDGAPIKQVVAFRRVFVLAGKSQVVKFTINVCQRLSIVEKTAYRVLASGEHTIMVGDDNNNVSYSVNVNLSH